MKIKRITEISIEATRRVVIQPTTAEECFLCPECNSPMLAAEHLAQLLGITPRIIYQNIETGAAHFIEAETGVVMICPPSFNATISNIDDALPDKSVKMTADSAAENQTKEIEIERKTL